MQIGANTEANPDSIIDITIDASPSTRAGTDVNRNLASGALQTGSLFKLFSESEALDGEEARSPRGVVDEGSTDGCKRKIRSEDHETGHASPHSCPLRSLLLPLIAEFLTLPSSLEESVGATGFRGVALFEGAAGQPEGDAGQVVTAQPETFFKTEEVKETGGSSHQIGSPSERKHEDKCQGTSNEIVDLSKEALLMLDHEIFGEGGSLIRDDDIANYASLTRDRIYHCGTITCCICTKFGM